MAKKKLKKNKHHGSNAAPLPGKMTLQDFAHTVFKDRANQFQKSGSDIDSVYEGLDFDAIRIKRRISSVLSVADEIKNRYSEICPDSPNMFSLAEDWVIMNSHPVSAFDHVEKYVFSTLGAAIWLLDYIRDHGRIDQLNEILRNAPLPKDIQLPDVWDPCHSQQLLRQMVSIINNRNSDCPVTEKAIRKNKATVERIYMDRPTAENKVDHAVPSRHLYDQVLSLIDPDALTAIVNTYEDKFWEWLRRYFLCRAIFNKEEQEIRAEIEDFQNQMQALVTQNAIISSARKPISILSNASNNVDPLSFDFKPTSEQVVRSKTLEYLNKVLYEKQEAFNARFSSFCREVGEFSLMPTQSIAQLHGEEIAQIWEGFSIDEPYSMCMAFLALLDRNSDLPWCYFPSVILQSCYVSMLPWTRTRFIPCCDDIWEHYDADLGAIVPGPSNQPLSKKIKAPDLDDWYRMQYHDSAKSITENNDLFNLAQIVYEVTGCLMPRNPERHLAALSTLNRYGINNKKTNQNLLYCMALLGEAKHQSLVTQLPGSQDDPFEQLPETVEELQAQVIALREELSHYKQTLQDFNNQSNVGASQLAQLQRQHTHRDILVHDLSSIVFHEKMPIISKGANFPYRTSSYFAVFSVDDSWIQDMQSKLPDILFLHDIPKRNPEIFKSMETIWVQPEHMPHDTYWRIIIEARKAEVPVRILPFADATSCATLLVHADISR